MKTLDSFAFLTDNIFADLEEASRVKIDLLTVDSAAAALKSEYHFLNQRCIHHVTGMGA